MELIDGKKITIKFIDKKRKTDGANYLQCQITFNRETNRFKIPIYSAFYWGDDEKEIVSLIPVWKRKYENWIKQIIHFEYLKTKEVYSISGLNDRLVKNYYLNFIFKFSNLVRGWILERLQNVLTYQSYILIESGGNLNPHFSYQTDISEISEFYFDLETLIKKHKIDFSKHFDEELMICIKSLVQLIHFELINIEERKDFFITTNYQLKNSPSVGDWIVKKDVRKNFINFYKEKSEGKISSYEYFEGSELFNFIEDKFKIEDISLNKILEKINFALE